MPPPPLSPTPSTGIEGLSDPEALALLLRRGSNGTSPRVLAQFILDRVGGLPGLRQASVRELTAIPGIGPVTASRIQAALVLGRRSVEVVRERLGPYRGARDVYEHLRPRIAHSEKETFVVLLLDNKNRLIREEVVSVGTLTASLVHPREVFRLAIRECAASLIVSQPPKRMPRSVGRGPGGHGPAEVRGGGDRDPPAGPRDHRGGAVRESGGAGWAGEREVICPESTSSLAPSRRRPVRSGGA